jgi:hypothetical protein
VQTIRLRLLASLAACLAIVASVRAEEAGSHVTGYALSPDREFLVQGGLPHLVPGLPAAVRAPATHACDVRAWGWFWPWTLVATIVAVARRRAYALLIAYALYALAFVVWSIVATGESSRVVRLASHGAAQTVQVRGEEGGSLPPFPPPPFPPLLFFEDEQSDERPE